MKKKAVKFVALLAAFFVSVPLTGCKVVDEVKDWLKDEPATESTIEKDETTENEKAEESAEKTESEETTESTTA